ncbi:MAG TPA: hypothetical protein VGD40_10495 [Chryseosolibacter sp.]
MTLEIKDDLNNLDISVSHITKVVEDKAAAYSDYKTFVVVYFAGGDTATLKGWTLEQWRAFIKSA